MMKAGRTRDAELEFKQLALGLSGICGTAR